MGSLLQIKGVQRLQQWLASKPKTAFRRVAQTIKVCGAVILAKSQAIVPVEFGNLKASGGMAADEYGVGSAGPMVRVTIFYTAAYAIYVHENLDALHGAAFNIAYADKHTRTVANLKRAQAALRTVRRQGRVSIGLGLFGQDNDMVSVEGLAKAEAKQTSTRLATQTFAPRGPNQQAKFLEQPFRELRPWVLAMVKQAVRG